MMSGSNPKQARLKNIFTNVMLILMVAVLAIVPLVVAKDAEFGGADDQAKHAISEINHSYEPWFSLIWEPPSGEIASM
jgi:cobalt/nickel transport protein